MRVRVDDRGVAVQVGVALLLAFLVVAISVYQTQVVPDENRQVELEHNQKVHSQLQDVRNAIVSVPGGGSGRSVSVKLGTDYPYRTLFLNPPPPGGQLRTTGPENLTIRNATADGEVGDFWNGSARNVSTRALVYRAEYNQFQRSPITRYENTVLFDAFERNARSVSRTDQALIDGNTITVVALNGTYRAASSSTVSVDLRAASTSDRVVTVGNASGLNVSVPTRMNLTEWRRLLEDEMESSGGRVSNVSMTEVPGEPHDRLEISLAPGTYRLRMAKVGIGSGVTTEEAAYLTDVAGDGQSVPVGGNQTLTVEVRDRFNNPVSGVRVGTDNDNVVPQNQTTDADGRASFVFQAPSTPGTRTITVNLTGSGPFPDEEKVTFDVTVESTGGAGGGDSAFNVSWSQAVAETGAITCDPSANDEPTRCTLDAQDQPTAVANVTMNTTPIADGAIVEYAVNDTSIATPNRLSGLTNSTGQNWTRVTATKNGTVSLYVSGGGSGDVLQLTVENVDSSQPLITAVQPDPAKMSTTTGEFVRVSFSTSTTVTDWKLVDEDTGQNTTFPSGSVSGPIYFARNPSRFAENWSVDPSRVNELDTFLNDGGEHLRLLDGDGDVVDEFAYEGSSTSNGWSIGVGSGEVAYRQKSGGSYVDNDERGDWSKANEHVFFNRYDATTPGPGVAFLDTATSAGYLQSIDSDGTMGFYDVVSSEVSAIGPMSHDLDGDGLNEIPYVDPNTNQLRIVDVHGENTVLVAPSDMPSGIAPTANTARIGVGDVDGNGQPEVYFTDNNNNYIWSKEVGGGSPTELTYVQGNTKNAQGFGIAGVADMNDDGDQDVVYVTTQPKIAFIDVVDDNRVRINAQPSAGYAVGSVDDYDADGNPEVPFVDGSGEVSLLTDPPTRSTTQLTSTGGSVKTSSLGAVEATGSGPPEVVYKSGNDGTLYYVTGGGTGGQLTDQFGYQQTAAEDPGVAILVRLRNSDRTFDQPLPRYGSDFPGSQFVRERPEAGTG